MSHVSIPDPILLQVEKPSRYIGGEVNSVMKDPSTTPVRIAFCFPDVYEIGMSHLGLQLLYGDFNQMPNVYCERAFAPWPDMEQKLRENHLPLYTLETFTPLREMDFVAFTLQYEMSFTNILNMLYLAGIPLYAADRDDNDPLIIAGGPTASNPEVLAPFIDFFYIGEGEVSYHEIFNRYEAHKAAGGHRRDFLSKILDLGPIYVPAYYDVEYYDTPAAGAQYTPSIRSIRPNRPDAPAKIRKDIVTDLETSFYPLKPIVPYLQTVHDRAVMEIFRGCIHGCRFCQAGQVYKPVRYRSKETVMAMCEELMKNTGYDEISFTSLSTDDYPWLEELMTEFHEKFPNIAISLPSLRVDAFSLGLMEKLAEGKKSGLTFAAEAGTQRLRDVINKGLTEEEILNGCQLAFSGGWDRVKLYFMLGLPTETPEDIDGIAKFGYKILDTWNSIPKEQRSRDVQITISTSFFVPKSFSAFQWAPQISAQEYLDKQHFLNSRISNRKIRYSCHDSFLSALEGLLARGDRRTSKLIYTAWKKGCRFDSWSDHFNEAAWREAIEECNIELDYYNHRERPADEIFPWDMIDYGVSKQWLRREYEKAMAGQASPDCLEKCTGCGMARFTGCGLCHEKREEQK